MQLFLVITDQQMAVIPFPFSPGNEIINLLTFAAYPTGIIDRVSGIKDRDYWFGLMVTRNSVPANVNIGVDGVFNPVTREFNTTIDFTALTNLNGQYMFNVILLESGIVWSQAGNSSCPGDPNYVHKNVVRDMMNSAIGEEVINGIWNENDVITKTINHTISVPIGPGPDMVWDSCEVVVMVYKSGSPLANNAEIQQAEKISLASFIDPYLTVISSKWWRVLGGVNKSKCRLDIRWSRFCSYRIHDR